MSGKILAWGVHLFTALGLVAAALIAVLIVRGDDAAFRTSFALMFAATMIDAFDGLLARKARVKEVLPGFDGRRLDDLIDFLTYTCLPLLLIWRARLAPEGYEAWLLAPLLASVYGFSQVNAKTEDGYFLGFPSYWNIAAYYAYFLGMPAWANLMGLLVLAVLTFVPTRYLYATQPGKLNRITNYLAGVWSVALIAILIIDRDQARALARISFAFPAYYMLISWWVTFRAHRMREG